MAEVVREEATNKEIDVRLCTIIGHMKAIRTMLNEGKDCEDIVVQLMAVEKSVKKTGILLLKNHLNHCIKERIETGDKDILISFNKILEMYL